MNIYLLCLNRIPVVTDKRFLLFLRKKKLPLISDIFFDPRCFTPHEYLMYASFVLTLLEPQSRSGDKPVEFQVVLSPNGTAVLKGLRNKRDGPVSYQVTHKIYSRHDYRHVRTPCNCKPLRTYIDCFVLQELT